MNQKYTPEEQSLKTILSHYAITDFTYKQSADGVENTTIFIFANNQNCVLRVYRLGSKTDAQIQAEIDFIYFLNENSFPTPEIFSNIHDQFLTKVVIDECEWQVILMEKVYGQEIPENEWVKNEDLLENMAQTQAELHLLGTEFAQINLQNDFNELVAASGIGKLLFERLNKLKQLSKLDKELLEIISNIKSLEYQYNPFLPFGYIHDDIDWNNLLLDDNDDINVIDFGDLRVGPIVSCLGSSLFVVILSAFELGENIQDFAQKYLDFYTEIRELENDELAELQKPIVLTLDLFIVSEILSSKQLNQKIKNYLKLKEEVLKLSFN
jgi:Ser/Thr protein kinase RdoA (MazF antagonist)